VGEIQKGARRVRSLVVESMAIGFALSSVHEIIEEKSEDAIYFELKNIRYKIIIDDMRIADELIQRINDIKKRKQVKDIPKPNLPEFYRKVL
jgi:protein involved in sex pheromone biosynthesis